MSNLSSQKEFPHSHVTNLCRAYGIPSVKAKIKSVAADFRVTEILAFQPSGQGEHVYLLIEKCNLNTEDVAMRIAKFCNVKRMAVSYAGLKDKHAITTQWFSVHLPGKHNINWKSLNSNNIVVKSVQHSNKKLKRGAIKANVFEITARNCVGPLDDVQLRIEKIESMGVPNYFTEQRFGRHDRNIGCAEKMFLGELKVKNRHLRSLYISAARSYIFNLILSERVNTNTWDTLISGDPIMLQGSKSYFSLSATEFDQQYEELKQRTSDNDIHPGSPLWGKGMYVEMNKWRAALPENNNTVNSDELHRIHDISGSAFENWMHVAQRYNILAEGLVKLECKLNFRAHRILPTELEWSQSTKDIIKIRFRLPAGAYATAILREICLTDV